jgi:Protein of unknown function (DUF3237)
MSRDQQSQTNPPVGGVGNVSGRPPPDPTGLGGTDPASVAAIAKAYEEEGDRTRALGFERTGGGAGPGGAPPVDPAPVPTRQEAPPPPPAPPSLLTISCDGARQVTSLERAPVAGGQRVVVTYPSGKVTGRANGEDVEGVVLNGGDWILVRDDDVVVFDAHFTIGKRELDADVLQDIAATVRRELQKVWDKDDFLVDLFLVGQAPLPDREEWKNGDVEIPFLLPVRMEAATSAPPWAKARFGDLAEAAKRFTTFTGHQCLARGRLVIEGGRVSAIKFDISPLLPSDIAPGGRT